MPEQLGLAERWIATDPCPNNTWVERTDGKRSGVEAEEQKFEMDLEEGCNEDAAVDF